MKSFIKHHPWKIIEYRYDEGTQQIAESLCSIGNGRHGQRANYAENYTGPTLQGTYIAGIYYPDKTRVGWWKNGYPEYFAKVLNAPDWCDLHIKINGIELDLNTWKILEYRRILDMEKGLLLFSYRVQMPQSNVILLVESTRLCHYQEKDLALLRYEVTLEAGIGAIEIQSGIDGDVMNADANYDEQFWHQYETRENSDMIQLRCETRRTGFVVQYSVLQNCFLSDTRLQPIDVRNGDKKIRHFWSCGLSEGDSIRLDKFTGIHTSFYHDVGNLWQTGRHDLEDWMMVGFNDLMESHTSCWQRKWQQSDIVIEGDIAAQQGIRFNIFQLNQTYTGTDPRLNIGPKGFTGEKYGGSTYWDTEAYCLPFYLSTADEEVARNLLEYRYRHLDKAIENAGKLGIENGAALYPMVTINGEECHNEWEITFEEIHRNGAIAYAIYREMVYTGRRDYLDQKGIEVLVAIARFWVRRVHFSVPKQCYVMHGVTGPNEYENNVNNNWYTNYIARWCLQFASDSLATMDEKVRMEWYVKLKLSERELDQWKRVGDNLFLPKDESGIFIQQEGFMDKELQPASQIPREERPINQHWSWDRILRSCYIKQADVLQGLYFFESDFSTEVIAQNFRFYEPMTVHESSLSPCVHAILAAKIGDFEKAYEMYLRTARLDLDDYNNDTEDGCHITSMAGTWMSIVEGFAGMRIKNDQLTFHPFCPDQWKSYKFHIQFRKRILEISVDPAKLEVSNHGSEISIQVDDTNHKIPSNSSITVQYH